MKGNRTGVVPDSGFEGGVSIGERTRPYECWRDMKAIYRFNVEVKENLFIVFSKLASVGE